MGLLGRTKKQKYSICEIIVLRPRKIEEEGWEVIMKIKHPNFDKWVEVDGKGESDHITIFSVTDQRLGEVINDDEKFKGAIVFGEKTSKGHIILSSPDGIK